MISIDLWKFAICFFGALECLLLACCFGFYPGENRAAQRLLSILMALLGGRILKSLWYVFEGEGMPLWAMNLGFAAHLAAAIILYQYVRTQTGKGQTWSNFFPIHLIPVVFILLGSPWLDLHDFWYRGAYHWLLMGSVAYWMAACKSYLETRYKTPARPSFRKGWLAVLLASTGVFFWAYFANYVFRLLPYSIAPVVYSLAVFPVGIAAWYSFLPSSREKSTYPKSKYQNLSPTINDLERAKEEIRRVLETERAYLHPEFSLQHLADQTLIPAHRLSYLLNQHMQTNFTTLVNSYRVEEACTLLLCENKAHYTIAAIAFEAGFTSLSTFNQHFKKMKGITPSNFRRQFLST